MTYAGKTGALALLDDQAARSHASKHQLPFFGTVGVLIAAKRKGLVEVIKPLLYELRSRNFHLSDKVIRDALIKSDERCH